MTGDDDIENAFRAARARPPRMPAALGERILRDAAAVQADRPRPARRRRRGRRAPSARPALAAGLAAMAAGFVLGLAAPGPLARFPGLAPAGADLVLGDLAPGWGIAAEGEG